MNQLLEATREGNAREITSLLREKGYSVSTYVDVTNNMEPIDCELLVGSTRNVSIVDLLAYDPEFYKELLPAIDYQLFTLLPLMRDDQEDESLAIVINYCDRIGMPATPLLVRVTLLIYKQLKTIGVDLFRDSGALKCLLDPFSHADVAERISSHPELKMKALWLIGRIGIK